MVSERVVRNRVRVLDLPLVVVLASLCHGSCIGSSRDVRYRAIDNRSPVRRVFQTVIVCELVWVLTSGPVVNVTGHVILVVCRCGQIGSAGSESVIVTAANVPVARVVATAGREFLEGVEIFFVLPLANFLDQEEDGAYNDGGTDQADNGKGRTHSRLVL